MEERPDTRLVDRRIDFALVILIRQPFSVPLPFPARETRGWDRSEGGEPVSRSEARVRASDALLPTQRASPPSTTKIPSHNAHLGSCSSRWCSHPTLSATSARGESRARCDEWRVRIEIARGQRHGARSQMMCPESRRAADRRVTVLLSILITTESARNSQHQLRCEIARQSKRKKQSRVGSRCVLSLSG